MAKRMGITTSEELRAWLRGKPARWSLAIAARTSLRTLPMVRYATDRTNGAGLLLAVFRANHIVWTASRYPSLPIWRTASAGAAIEARSGDVVSKSALPAIAVAYGAARASNPAIAAANVPDILEAAAEIAGQVGAAAASGEIWRGVEEDAAALSERTASVEALMVRRLWEHDVRGDPTYRANFPLWARQPFDDMTEDQNLIRAGFKHWFSWYRKILPNNMGGPTSSHFGAELDVHIASQPDTWWDRDPNAVNADIGAWLHGQPLPSADGPPRPTVAQFILDVLESRGRPTSNSDIVEAFKAAAYPVI